ncbi:hypothetical protein [Scytonema sp. NUACC26]|uniref:hypothetical protein n=1 Tax=Scytonema sp. NUACC26 TaxID=3140176 RepID=UPI0034DC0BF3
MFFIFHLLSAQTVRTQGIASLQYGLLTRKLLLSYEIPDQHLNSDNGYLKPPYLVLQREIQDT